jgi:hypothetical protein
MRARTRVLLVVSLLFTPAPASPAQAGSPATGHWVGVVDMGDVKLDIEIDLSRNAAGQFVATFGQPGQGVKGLPFREVTVNGRTVRLVLNAGEQPSTFDATVSEDGQTMTGEATQTGASAPFVLTRKGDARVVTVAASTPIAKALEGTWHATLDVGGRQQRLVLTLRNNADGTASGTVMSPDGSGVEIPVAIVQKGSDVTIDVPSVGASLTAVLNAAGTEISGTWKQSAMALPVTFRRAP